MIEPSKMKLKSRLDLPCGAVLKNRIAKSAMSENMSPRHHGPTQSLVNVYQRWVEGGAGLILTGNIMVDGKAMAEPGNILVEDESQLEQLQEWASIVKDSDVHLWPQINHPGRQAIGVINKNVVAPSAVKMDVKGMSGLFKKPKKLSESEIYEIIERFGNTAAILKKAGFTGVQIHGAHGYLVSQFLSPLTNQREDQWGGSLENRSRFVLEVYRNIRSQVGPTFPVGIKLNSADFQKGGFTEEESMDVVKLLDAEGIDLLEISGGTYERPAMTGIEAKASTKAREAYFMEYVLKVRQFIKCPLMLTGGFRSVENMERVISERELDVVGIARPFAIYPNLAKDILEGKIDRLDIPKPKTGIKMLDNSGFVDIKWYEMHIHRLGKGKEVNLKLSPLAIINHNLSTTFQKLMFGRKKN